PTAPLSADTLPRRSVHRQAGSPDLSESALRSPERLSRPAGNRASARPDRRRSAGGGALGVVVVALDPGHEPAELPPGLLERGRPRRAPPARRTGRSRSPR